MSTDISTECQSIYRPCRSTYRPIVSTDTRSTDALSTHDPHGLRPRNNIFALLPCLREKKKKKKKAKAIELPFCAKGSGKKKEKETALTRIWLTNMLLATEGLKKSSTSSMACENSHPSSLPARVAFSQATSSRKDRIWRRRR